MDDRPLSESFAPHVGGTFRLDDGTALTLVAVDRPRDVADSRAFTLIFRGATQPLVAEGVYRLSHPDGRVFTLYMMPIHTPAPGHQDYQIVFN